MKKPIITLCLLLAVALARGQGVGMSCQYFPGVQVGFVGVKFDNHPKLDKYRFGAGLPILLIDRISNHWYTNIDLSALYYGATQTNKANDNRIKISKAEGAIVAGRAGYLFGDGDNQRIGFSLNLGYGKSNLDSAKLIEPFKRGYINYGLGLVAYKKFGKLRFAGKLGYEMYRKKNFVTKGGGFYVEGTVGYSIYQKYGLSIMPCFYSKKLTFVPEGLAIDQAATGKVRSFVLRIGLTRFF